MKPALRVQQIAERTRLWAEQYARDHNFPRDLRGMCAIASAKLLEQLYDAKFTAAYIVYNGSHCFVMWNDYIVDITATQFNTIFRSTNNGSVVMFKAHVSELQGYWRCDKTFTSTKALHDFLQLNEWPQVQTIPFALAF